jgi:hypothetical protein
VLRSWTATSPFLPPGYDEARHIWRAKGLAKAAGRRLQVGNRATEVALHPNVEPPSWFRHDTKLSHFPSENSWLLGRVLKLQIQRNSRVSVYPPNPVKPARTATFFGGSEVKSGVFRQKQRFSLGEMFRELSQA